MFEEKWAERFIDLAKTVSSWSKDPAKKIGAVIVNNENKVVSMGFNGFPRSIQDTEDRLNNKDFKRAICLHAEENAILCAKQDLKGCSIYIYGLPPCAHCAAMIIQSGIKDVFYRIPEEYKVSNYWKDNLEIAKEIFYEASILELEV